MIISLFERNKTMKRILIFLFLFIFPIALTACGNANENLIKNNMSEITQDYFFGENDNYSVSLSCGKREEPYLLNGKSEKKVDFSLIVLKDKHQLLNKNFVEANFINNGENVNICLQYNPFNNCYMYDLGYKVSKEMAFQLNAEIIQFEKINFNIDSQNAIKISCKMFEDLIENYKTDGKLYAEFYLKVLGDKQGDNLYWCFTIIGQDDKCFNLILSTNDGKVVASD